MEKVYAVAHPHLETEEPQDAYVLPLENKPKTPSINSGAMKIHWIMICWISGSLNTTIRQISGSSNLCFYWISGLSNLGVGWVSLG